ncbi:immunoglobulin-like domain-containing protein [Bifidobacterium callitrichidarum]|uniref:Pesticidal crystal protein Cry22Aa Ig-like domain-containing protein n=1 Tax=Bifidobacterium callitrichidarum TaxID=2052941 RepID=A0A2U2NCJ7_9BIFI|nr:immunoglobulin-like domain-containing protein [Bifidobacterium callitrichidarum]PWG66754.1 hypothetical protein DF196_02295 [Bifidobacterium callitrichidarum]
MDTYTARLEFNANTKDTVGNMPSDMSYSVRDVSASAAGSHYFTIPSNRPTRAGYAFKGWATTSKGGVEYSPNDGISVRYDRTVTLYAVWSEDNPPTIEGATDKTIPFGSKFDPAAGVKATDKEDGDITSRMTVIGKVNTGTAGKYMLTYVVQDSAGHTVSVKRVITVKPEDRKPTINGADDKTILTGTAFDPKKGVTATDPEDGDITSRLKITGSVKTDKPGKYTLTYTVTDSGGNTVTVTRVITVLAGASKMPSTGSNTYVIPRLVALGALTVSTCIAAFAKLHASVR